MRAIKSSVGKDSASYDHTKGTSCQQLESSWRRSQGPDSRRDADREETGKAKKKMKGKKERDKRIEETKRVKETNFHLKKKRRKEQKQTTVNIIIRKEG